MINLLSYKTESLFTLKVQSDTILSAKSIEVHAKSRDTLDDNQCNSNYSIDWKQRKITDWLKIEYIR